MKRVGGGKKHCLAKKKLISRRQRSNQTSTFISNWHHFLSVVNLIVRHIALCFFHEFRRLVWAVGSYSAVQPAGRIWYRKKHITKHSAPLDARRCTNNFNCQCQFVLPSWVVPTERTAVGIMSPEARTSSNLAINCDNLEDGWCEIGSHSFRAKFFKWENEYFPAM